MAFSWREYRIQEPGVRMLAEIDDHRAINDFAAILTPVF
jgi:hypothetical protein